ncbi:MAG: cyclopropane fatty acyl phospholipid synthase [Deltaproteobacteria bacterium]|nr:cyclopropane fatty acyl phospholipid synthase [Deltaproteobacteria bacterium]
MPGLLFPTAVEGLDAFSKEEKRVHRSRYRTIKKLFSSADIVIDGERPWDILVHDDDFYRRVAAEGSIALGESYVDGWWDCPRLDEFFLRILRADLDEKVRLRTELLDILKAKVFNLQKPSRAYFIGKRHYDIGNRFYRHMLDKRLIYSCGYWENASTLDEAQEAKLDLVCGKLGLKPGMRILDIGCGWGGTAQFVAEKYRVCVIGITVSEEQARFAREFCGGLSVEIRRQDYRELDEPFDRILSIGMFEHVGVKNYRTFMSVVRKCLKEDGLFLLQTIGRNRSVSANDPWIEKYIFPNSMLPSAKQICSAVEGLFVIEDWHGFGHHYDTTLVHWFRNFHENWDAVKDFYDERFYRMWKYYLLSCAGSFRARKNQLWQIVFSPHGVTGGYRSLR